MRNYGRFTTSIYRDSDFRSLTLAQQGLYYLLGLQAEMSAAGTLSLTLRRWSSMAADLSVEELRDHLKTLEAHGHVVVDDDTEELLIVKFVKWDGGIGNEKRRPVIEEAATSIASPAIRQTLAHEIRHLGYVDMASKVHADATYPQTHDPSDAESRFDRSVVKQGDQIPHPLSRIPHSLAATPGGEPPEAAGPIAADASADPPSMFCSKHPEGTEQPCGACAGARKRYTAWAQAALEADVEAKRVAAEARKACELCDDAGMRLHPKSRLPVGRCDHETTEEPA